jgi:hypothetical protein
MNHRLKRGNWGEGQLWGRLVSRGKWQVNFEKIEAEFHSLLDSAARAGQGDGVAIFMRGRGLLKKIREQSTRTKKYVQLDDIATGALHELFAGLSFFGAGSGTGNHVAACRKFERSVRELLEEVYLDLGSQSGVAAAEAPPHLRSA